MTQLPPPKVEPRRTSDFERALVERALAWIPELNAEAGRDFGRAVLAVAARFASEVGERLDRAPDKAWRGFLDWLGVRGDAARAARMPIVFKPAARTTQPVLARAPVALQAEGVGGTVMFETQSDLTLTPGRLDLVVGVDVDADEFFVSPPGLSEIEPPEAAPDEWRLKSFAAEGATKIQLDPAAGLAPGAVLRIDDQEYGVAEVNGDLVTIARSELATPGLAADADAGARVQRVKSFTPFDGTTRGQQLHAVYIGDADFLNLEARATIDVIGGQEFPPGVKWQYWGLLGEGEPGWQTLEPPADGSPQPGDAIRLVKEKGSVEPLNLGSTKGGRWIRAVTGALPGRNEAIAVERLTLRVNPTDALPVPDSLVPSPQDLPPVDVIVNTTVSTSFQFYPLGREPRLSDALYIGCPEVFSKPRARAQVRFDLAGSTLRALAALSIGGVQLLAGVDEGGTLNVFSVLGDGKLARFGGLPPTRPSGGGSEGVRLTSATLRPVLWTEDSDQTLVVTVAGDSGAYQWRGSLGTPAQSTWSPRAIAYPSVPSLDAMPLTGLIGTRVGKEFVLVALRGDRLFRSTSNGFREFQLELGKAPQTCLAIAPVIDEAGRGPSDTFLAVVGQGQKRVLCTAKLENISGDALGIESVNLGHQNVDLRFVPFAMQRQMSSIVEIVAVCADGSSLVAANGTQTVATKGSLDLEPVSTGACFLDGIVDSTGALKAFLVGTTSAGIELISWAPFDPDVDFARVAFRTSVDTAVGLPKGSLSIAGDLAFVPAGGAGQVIAARLRAGRSKISIAPEDFLSALGVRNPPPPLAPGDLAVADFAVPLGAAIGTAESVLGAGEFVTYRFSWLDRWINASTSAAAAVYPTGKTGSTATIQPSGGKTLEFSGDDPLQDGDVLRIEDKNAGVYYLKIKNVFLPVGTTPGHFDLDVVHVPISSADVNFWRAIDFPEPPHVFPALNVPAGNWSLADLSLGDLYFPELDEPRQRVIAILPRSSGEPQIVALENAVKKAPGVYFVDQTVDEWFSALTDTSSNPALAWEYWNGSGWWRLSLEEETTNDLRNSGHVVFRVPDDLRPVDWAGKTSHWIRARLVGGDYGRETFVTVSTTKDGVTTQTSERRSEGIQPPFVLSMWVTYDVPDPVVPRVLQTLDSGLLHDQSDANRAPGVDVATFIPLVVSLGGLLSGARGRVLLLGVAAAATGSTANVLFMTPRGQGQDAFAPLAFQALVGNQFGPIMADDGTRALGQTGVVTLSFPEPPTALELFGNTLRWVAMMPHVGSGATWSPTLSGAYLNGVWASSTETLTRELLGSSDGRPSLLLRLARPPVLHDTLELRVREPLGEDERNALVAADPTQLVSNDPSLPGDWVRWERVADPDDEEPTRRCYALEEATGTIRFGDGQHGAIPPIGRDSVVAFSYRRTEPPAPGASDVPANGIEARIKLNLVTPVEGVEAVFSADHAAGGAPPEPDERVLRFGSARLRHRGRALSLRDLEALVLASSPSIAQVLASQRRGRIRLVIVMAGAEPVPTEAQKREIERLLLDVVPASLPLDALQLVAPKIRSLQLRIKLLVRSLDRAAGVAAEAEARLRRYFDAQQGGRSGEGWPLGESPDANEIAFALLDLPELLGTEEIELLELAPTGIHPFPPSLAAEELARLAADGLRFEFESEERAA